MVASVNHICVFAFVDMINVFVNKDVIITLHLLAYPSFLYERLDILLETVEAVIKTSLFFSVVHS